mmetsp:Transcript_22729/g.34131  ORF Transcript_22729/g.34131 Transcript_22729/m.34131 type:complete len:178 (-) Transcript_22729:133-666(-)|eukprot:CAMPEP_0194778142 /NCGR_PEP_ID=MMETSP0323_2-20130528/67451_1 /TAXON_ID=2866 ORGANISM="Crypthecodinium cohnii, Strain Seligo" /NCGR_SAMPLE_ID=MMETSP0323_2 /ASSEMBLY_ACC=CAM_ASM_000346 /LENGTH=177 /DNA_ID=CAMNT_0039715203 /DNA_START=20 /DNA_END=553 /DNA_ORIENTATION=-
MSGLNNLNKVLRLGGQTGKAPSGGSTIPTAALPEWLKEGAVCIYTSQSRGDSHRVKVKALEERKQTVLFTFEADKRVWKRVSYMEAKGGSGALRPAWKENLQVAGCEGPPPEMLAQMKQARAAEASAAAAAPKPTAPEPRPQAAASAKAAPAATTEVSDDDDVEAVGGPPAKARKLA